MVIVPRHIGVIMDGNRRFARELLKRPWEGHEFGLKKTREVLQWACEYGIKYITAYTLSIENLTSRPRKELKMILKLLEKESENVLTNPDHVVHKFFIKVRFIGRLEAIPEELRVKLRQVEEKTKNYKKHALNIALAYGGQQEIVDATKKIITKTLKGIIKPSDVNEEMIKSHLYTNGQPHPDLIIRTGGENRLSNFLSFQSAYSELIFIKKRWPEFSKEDFKAALDEFANRQRRFGS